MLNKQKILVIEDEEILLDVLEKKLEKENYRVITAIDGKDGLSKAITMRPDLILLDIVLPKLNGYEVLEGLKKNLGENMPPVIIISNSGQPVEIDKAMNLGAKDYIIKVQFTPEEVIAKINNLVAQMERNKQVSPTKIDDKASKPRILIVEDDQFLRDLLESKLIRENFEVSLAIDGLSGWDKISKEKPDLVLLDIILPGISGFDILKKVREDSSNDIASIPIILLSNLGQESDIEKGRILGADDYLIKANFTIDEIIDKIQNLLNKRKKI